MTFDKLVDFILEYESDTFSAPDLALERAEAVEIAKAVLERAAEHLDGVTLSGILYDLTEEGTV